MKVEIHFKLGNEEIILPVSPESLVISSDGENISSSTIKLGEINILRDRKLKTLSIESEFPLNNNYPYIVRPDILKKPHEYIKFFTDAQEGKEVLELSVTGLNIAFFVSIESFEVSHVAQDTDVHYNLSLKEYRFYGNKSKELTMIGDVDTATNSASYETSSQNRPSNGFAIGDRVTASGMYYSDPWGAKGFVATDLSLMSKQATLARVALQKASKIRVAEIQTQECVIIDIEADSSYRVNTIIDAIEVKSSAMYPYQLASANKKAIGWFSDKQLKVI